jgi:hypothetical protein
MVIESYLNSIQPTSNIRLSDAHIFDGMPYLDVIKSFIIGNVTTWGSVGVVPNGCGEDYWWGELERGKLAWW